MHVHPRPSFSLPLSVLTKPFCYCYYPCHLATQSVNEGLSPCLELQHSTLTVMLHERTGCKLTQRERLTKFHSAPVEPHFQSKNHLYFIYTASQNVYWEQRWEEGIFCQRYRKIAIYILQLMNIHP